MKGAAIGFVLLVAATGAFARDGNQLLDECQLTIALTDKKQSFDDPVSAMKMGRCHGVVSGVTSMLIINHDYLPKNIRACIPEGYKNGQGVRIVTNFLKANPEVLHEDETWLVMLSLIKAYPCTT